MGGNKRIIKDEWNIFIHYINLLYIVYYILYIIYIYIMYKNVIIRCYHM